MEDLHRSVNHYFPKEQFMMLQNYVEEKDRFKVPDRSIAFNVADSSLVSAFILQVTLKLLLLEFW